MWSFSGVRFEDFTLPYPISEILWDAFRGAREGVEFGPPRKDVITTAVLTFPSRAVAFRMPVPKPFDLSYTNTRALG